MNKIFILLFLFFVNAIASEEIEFGTIDVSDPGRANLFGSSGEGGSSGGNFESQDSNPIIKRSITPNYEEFVIKNKSIYISVEIANKGRIIDDILLKETIDENLENISDFYICIVDPMYSMSREIDSIDFTNKTEKAKKSNDIKNLLNNLSENYTIVNNSIYIKNQTARGHPALKDGVCFGPRASVRRNPETITS